MTNKEKVELYRIASLCDCCRARLNDFNKRSYSCTPQECNEQTEKNFDWLMEDYKPTEMSESCVNVAPIEVNEPRVDWSKVPVDTLIEVSDDKIDWNKRYFAKFDNDKVYAWDDGRTSKTIYDKDWITYWRYARLVEGQQ